MDKQTKQKASGAYQAWTIVGIVLCALLLPILVVNVTLIVKSYTNKDAVPSFGGLFPLIVLTDSMYPDIQSGDLILCKQVDPEAVAVDDVISFFDPAGNGSSIVTHRVVEVTEEDGRLAFRTKGDANNVEDKALVPADKVVGAYLKRIPKAGNVAMFLQTTEGLILCVVLPLVLLVGYDILRTRKLEKANRQSNDELMAELEALRAAKAEKEKQAAEAPQAPPKEE